MPTLAEFRQRMLVKEPALGRTENIASLAVKQIVVTRLATGTIGSEKFQEKWLLRPDAASPPADRLRFVANQGFASSTGTLTHAGASYADTTATSEVVEIHEYEPYQIDLAIQEALRTVKFHDTVLFPGRLDGIYELSAYSWISGASDVLRTGRRRSIQLNDDRHFEKWFTISTAGALEPTGWTLAGSGGTFARSTTRRRGRYALSATRSGTNLRISRRIPIGNTGVGSDNLQGENVVAVVVARSGTASSVRAEIESLDANDATISSTNSAYHDGDDDWQELSTVAHPVNTTNGHELRLSALVEQDEAALIDELYLVHDSLTDSARRDDAGIEWDGERPTLREGPLTLIGPRLGKQGMIAVETLRPFPEFDDTRLQGGTADADSSDAPLDLIATVALGIFYENLASSAKGTQLDGQRWQKWQRRADNARARLIASRERESGLTLVSGRPHGMPARSA